MKMLVDLTKLRIDADKKRIYLEDELYLEFAIEILGQAEAHRRRPIRLALHNNTSLSASWYTEADMQKSNSQYTEWEVHPRRYL